MVTVVAGVVVTVVAAVTVVADVLFGSVSVTTEVSVAVVLDTSVAVTVVTTGSVANPSMYSEVLSELSNELVAVVSDSDGVYIGVAIFEASLSKSRLATHPAANIVEAAAKSSSVILILRNLWHV